jgi:hypothetical protein
MSAVLRPRRWIVVIGILAGALIFGAQLARHETLVRALSEGLGIDLATMVVCGVSARFWRGDDLEEASLGGAGVGFKDAAEPIRTVNERVDAQVSELEERIYALEEEKEAEGGTIEERPHESDPQG